MDWTPKQKLKYLSSLNWTVTVERDPDEGYVILRVKELPAVIATGKDNQALEEDFWESLEASLQCALEFGDPIQLPNGGKAPWEQPTQLTPIRNVVFQENVKAYVPQSKQTGSAAAVNRAPKELAVA